MMQNKDAVFTTHYEEIHLPNINTRFTIKPFGDVHRNAPACEEERWLNFLEWCKEDDAYTRYLVMGDVDDIISASERVVFSDRKIHESTRSVMDDFAEAKTNDTIKEIGFMKNKTLGMIQGNHYWEFDAGDTSTSRICKALNCKWLGFLSYIRLAFRFGKRGHRVSIDIVACHGKAGGKLVGTSINQVDDLRRIFPAADIYIMGHNHKKGALPASALIANSTGGEGEVVLHQKRQWLARSGSFLRGYVPDQSNYVTGRLYAPTDLGVIRFDVDFKRMQGKNEKTGGTTDVIRPDIHVWS